MYETSHTVRMIATNKVLREALDREYEFILNLKGNQSLYRFQSKSGISSARMNDFLTKRPKLLSVKDHRYLYKSYGISADSILGFSDYPQMKMPTYSPNLNTPYKRLVYLSNRIGRSFTEMRNDIGYKKLLWNSGNITTMTAVLLANKYRVSVDWLIDTANMYNETENKQ